jgi:hypothetical protein
MKKLLEFKNKTADEIVAHPREFGSGWHVYQARCWLDYCDRKNNVNGLYYAALELRLGIESLWFTHVLVEKYENLTEKEYRQYTQSHGKLRDFVRKAQPKYEKLAKFTNLCMKNESSSVRVIVWDVARLIKAHIETSKKLHFHGMAKDSWNDNKWIAEFKELLHSTVTYLWDEMVRGGTGVMDEESMEPEVRDMWGQYQHGKLSDEDCISRLKIAGPMFRHRKTIRDSLTSPIFVE